MNSPVVLVEVGTEPEGLAVPVITKDERITNVCLDWSTEMPLDLIEAAIGVLAPIRGDHPRFGIVLDRLELRRERARAMESG